MIIGGRVRPQRTCDRCGALRPGEAFRVISGRWICNYHDHYVAPETLEKIPIRTFPTKPFKDAKPFEPRDTFEKAEWELLNFLAESFTFAQYTVPDFAPMIPVSSTSNSFGVDTAGWTGIYLYELITEGKRPLRMISFAKDLLKTIADYLLTRQYSAPHTLAAGDNTTSWWGAFPRTVASYPASSAVQTSPAHVAAAGLAMLRAYQIHGDQRYLDSSRAALWFCRTAQSCGKLATKFSTRDAAGTSRVEWGTWTDSLFVGPGALPQPDIQFFPRSLIAAEFYSAFMLAIGDEVIGSPSLDSGRFVSSRESTISAALAEALNFWHNGVFDDTRQQVINGFSANTPYESFNSYGPGKSLLTGTGSWRYADGERATGTYFFAESWAIGLRSLHKVEGPTAQVTSVFDWLMTFSQNSTLNLPTAYNDRFLYAPNYTNGPYDPTFGLAVEQQVRAGSPLADVAQVGAISQKSYNLGCTGLMAALYSTRQPAGFKKFKTELNEPRHHTVGRGEDGRYHYLYKTGCSGFSLQPTQANARVYLPLQAARIGFAYRYAPQAFMGTGQ